MQELTKGKRVMIIAHADGDGYLAAEQSRRNAVKSGAVSCKILADPAITPGYRFWERHLESLELGDAGVVLFVDLMLNYKAPLDSLARIEAKARANPDRQFIVIDHHPCGELPSSPRNLLLRFTDKVYECCLGEPTELMLIASICDRDEYPVRDRINENHRLRAIGVSRAAADRKGLAGGPLVRLLQEDRWDVIEALGQEDRQFHRTVRGVRPASTPVSPALEVARGAVG